MKLSKMLGVALFSLALPGAALAQSDTGQPQGTEMDRKAPNDTGKMNEPAPSDKSDINKAAPDKSTLDKTNPDVNKNDTDMNKKPHGTSQQY